VELAGDEGVEEGARVAAVEDVEREAEAPAQGGVEALDDRAAHPLVVVRRAVGGRGEELPLEGVRERPVADVVEEGGGEGGLDLVGRHDGADRKSTRLNSSHVKNSYA